jgi:spore coat polysaccharide biosynthesis protein SpsF
MRTVAIIQARMGSTRLPGKTLQDLGGKTVLMRVVERVLRMQRINDLSVATTTNEGDDGIVEMCRENGVHAFRGSDEDVLDRYYQAACLFNADAIVRITADCPLIDPEVSDHVVQQFLDLRPDYASNALRRTYPRGLDTEVISIGALERAWQSATELYQRAHVTPYIYQHPKDFILLSVTGEDDQSRHRWTLDTPEDLQFLRMLYAKLPDARNTGWREVLRIVEREPELININRHIAQKALHEG